MKRLISLTLTITICLTLLMTITSCSFNHPIEEFKEKMDKADSCQISMTMSNVPILGTYTITMKADGNITYTSATMVSEEMYTETVDDITYQYTKNSYGKWTKTKQQTTENTSAIDEDAILDLFNYKNYEKVKNEENTYKQKSNVVIDGFENVKIALDDDSCIINATTISEGISYDIKIVISKINQIELTLPTIE